MKPKQTGMNGNQARIIVAMAENNLRPQRVAKALHYSRTNVDYHVQRVRELTGKDPRDFFDMCELLPVAREILAREEAAENG